MPPSTAQGRSLSILCFLVTFYAVRLFLIGHLQLCPDEAFYWYWSKNLDLSYLEHPPMVAYIMALFTWIGGDNEFAVRIGGLLCTLVSHVFLYLTFKKASGNDSELAWELLFIFNLTLLFSAGCIIQTPDTPLLLFWTIALYGCTQVFTGGGKGWWYASGAALGLGLLSKYTMMLMIPCVFAFLLVSPPHRYWLLRKEPYLATLLGALVFSPVIVWNTQHHWASPAFQLTQGFSPVREPPVLKLLEYVGGQIGVVTPLLFLAFLSYSLWGLFFSRQRRASEVLYLAILSWPILVFFGASTLRGEVAEANWPAPAYIAGLPLMWIVYRRHFRDKPGHKRFMKGAVGLALILNLAAHVHLVRPILPLPRGMDPTWQFYGWRELGENMEAHVKAHPWEEGYFLVGEGPPIVAETVFYTGNRYVGLDFTCPDRYTFLRGVDELKGRNAILLSQDSNASALERLKPYFEEVVVLGKNRYYYRGELNKRLDFYILLGKEFRGNGHPSGLLPKYK